MKNITAREILSLVECHDAKIGGYEAEVVQKSTRKSAFVQVDRNNDEVGEVDVETLKLCSKISYQNPSKDFVVTFCYEAELSFAMDEIAKLNFNHFCTSSIYNEKCELEGYHIVDYYRSDSIEGCIKKHASILKEIMKAKVREYLSDNGMYFYDEHPTAEKNCTYYSLRSDTDFDLCFTGRLVGEVGSKNSGHLRLYETNDEIPVFVCRRVIANGPIETMYCDTSDQVIDFFGFGKLAKKLYQAVGFRHIRKVSRSVLDDKFGLKKVNGQMKYPI